VHRPVNPPNILGLKRTSGRAERTGHARMQSEQASGQSMQARSHLTKQYQGARGRAQTEHMLIQNSARTPLSSSPPTLSPHITPCTHLRFRLPAARSTAMTARMPAWDTSGQQGGWRGTHAPGPAAAEPHSCAHALQWHAVRRLGPAHWVRSDFEKKMTPPIGSGPMVWVLQRRT
jgi:hypothetical protein